VTMTRQERRAAAKRRCMKRPRWLQWL
jgi:hypothetical protein